MLSCYYFPLFLVKVLKFIAFLEIMFVKFSVTSLVHQVLMTLTIS